MIWICSAQLELSPKCTHPTYRKIPHSLWPFSISLYYFPSLQDDIWICEIRRQNSSSHVEDIKRIKSVWLSFYSKDFFRFVSIETSLNNIFIGNLCGINSNESILYLVGIAHVKRILTPKKFLWSCVITLKVFFFFQNSIKSQKIDQNDGKYHLD